LFISRWVCGMRIFQAKVVQKVETHISCSVVCTPTPFPKIVLFIR
jgi:hypothetical protein